MASTPETVDHIRAALSPAGEISARKMFGEYGIYCDSVFIGTICDDQLFLKVTEDGAAIAGDVPRRPPYPGAKPSLAIMAERLGDAEWLVAVVQATRAALAKPGR